MGWVAVNKSWQRSTLCGSISGGNEERKSVLEIAFQGQVQACGDVGLPWEKAGWSSQLFVEKLEFLLLGFEVLKIRAGQDEIENQESDPNEIAGVGAMITKVLLANQIVNLA